jgi:hypothetical protein
MYGYGKHELECDNSSKGWWNSLICFVAILPVLL